MLLFRKIFFTVLSLCLAVILYFNYAEPTKSQAPISHPKSSSVSVSPDIFYSTISHLSKIGFIVTELPLKINYAVLKDYDALSIKKLISTLGLKRVDIKTALMIAGANLANETERRNFIKTFLLPNTKTSVDSLVILSESYKQSQEVFVESGMTETVKITNPAAVNAFLHNSGFLSNSGGTGRIVEDKILHLPKSVLKAMANKLNNTKWAEFESLGTVKVLNNLAS